MQICICQWMYVGFSPQLLCLSLCIDALFYITFFSFNSYALKLFSSCYNFDFIFHSFLECLYEFPFIFVCPTYPFSPSHLTHTSRKCKCVYVFSPVDCNISQVHDHCELAVGAHFITTRCKGTLCTLYITHIILFIFILNCHDMMSCIHYVCV